MSRGSRRHVAAPAQELLDPAILERVERHHGEPAAGRQQLLGRGEAAIELAQFVVHGDPQGLECPGRRILPGLGLRDHRANDIRELGGAPDGPALSRRVDRAGDPAGKPLFAKRADQLGKVGLRQGRDQIRGALSGAAHPHVERAVEAEREAALRRVELGRGDAEIEGNSGDRVGVHRGQELRHVAEPSFEDTKAFAVTLGQVAAPPHRLGIAVDAEDPAMRRIEQRLAVAAAAEGAVDIDGIVARGQRSEHGVEKNRNVPGRSDRLGPIGLCCWFRWAMTAARSFPAPLGGAARRRQSGSLAASALAQHRLVIGEAGRLPDLKTLPQPDKRRAFGNVGMLGEVFGQDDSALGIERQRVRRREQHSKVLVLLGKLL